MKTRLSIPVIIQYLLAITSLLAAVSCEDKTEFAAKGDPIQISINARTKYSDALSRDILDNEINVTNYTFLYYVREEGVLKLKTMKDFLPKDLPASLIIECPGINESNLAILIANVTTESMIEQGLALNSDISALNNITYDVTRFDNDPDDAKKFTWSGYHEVKSDTRVIDFVLNPNVAKLKVTIIDNTSTESQVVNLRMKQVRNKVRYAQNALYRSGYSDESGVDQNDRGYVYYDMEGMELSKESGSTYSWYIPHNEPIHIPGKTYSRRSGDVPLGSTYLEIDGLRNIDFMCSAYRIYPGVSEGETDYMDLSNYNVIADYQYNITVTIHDDGMEYSGTSGSGWYIPDPGYKNLSVKVKLPGESNSYIIQPKVQNISDGKRVWELFPSERVNDYWGTVKGDASRTLTKYSKWKVEVIWQDINARALCFCNEYGEKKNVDYYIGEGLNPMYFTLDDDLIKETAAEGKNSTDDIYGNILIGLKLLDDNGNVVLFNDNNKRNLRSDGKSDYLWSWHLWVTDYSPDSAPTNTSHTTLWESGKNVVDYQGYKLWNGSAYSRSYPGNVQHYYHWGNVTWYKADGSASPSDKIWTSGIYKNKWIMDRNLGAQASHNGLVEDPIEGFGMYYQYGRKDPFPYHGAKPAEQDASYQYSLYEIDGSTKVAPWIHTNGKVSMNVGVMNPMLFFDFGPGDENSVEYRSWTTDANLRPWFSPTTDTNVTNTNGKKTLFDPCPPGWCIPRLDTFDFMNVDNGIYTKGNGYPTHWTVASVFLYYNTKTTVANVAPSSKVRNYVKGTIRPYDGATALEINIPIQGYIANYSTQGGLPALQLPINTGAATGIDIRGYMWCVDPCSTYNHYASGYGFGASHENVVPAAYCKLNSSYYLKLPSTQSNGWWIEGAQGFYKTGFSSSRGQVVRCIQEP